jgi:hypothetical protein
MSKSQVRLLNGAHERGFTSLKNAKRYVARGHARWRQHLSGPAIEFTQTHPAHERVLLSEPGRIDGRFDNRSLPATLEEQRHLPLLTINRKVHQRKTRGRLTTGEADGGLLLMSSNALSVVKVLQVRDVSNEEQRGF